MRPPPPVSEPCCSEMLTPNAFPTSAGIFRGLTMCQELPATAQCDWEISGQARAVPHQDSSQTAVLVPVPEAWPCPDPDAPPSCGVWEGSCCHGPSIWCVGVAHCVYPLPWAPSTEHAAPLHEAALLSFRKEQEPHVDLSPPPGPPLAGPVLAPRTSLKAIGITL